MAKPLTCENPELNIRITLAEIDRLLKQARSMLEVAHDPTFDKHLKFISTLEHYLHKDREHLFLSEPQLKYLCWLAKVNADRYIYITLD